MLLQTLLFNVGLISMSEISYQQVI